MLDRMTHDITRILQSIDDGDTDATRHLLPLVYDELRKLAARKLSHESPGQTLQPTALVHEVFLRIVGDINSTKWDSRGHFFAAAAESMRRILIENARRKKAAKRGGSGGRIELDDEVAFINADEVDELLELDQALIRLAENDKQLAQLVELRYFAGLSIEETAKVLNISPSTAKRNWAYARAWLRREIDGENA